MFRSQNVFLYSVKTNSESAWELLNVIGCHNSAMIESSSTELASKAAMLKMRQLDEQKGKLEALLFRAKKFKVKEPSDNIDIDKMEEFLKQESIRLSERPSKLLDSYLSEADAKLKYFNDCHANLESMLHNCVQLMAQRAVLANVETLMPPNFKGNQSSRAGQQYVPIGELDQVSQSNEPSRISVGYYAGLIDTADIDHFSRIVYRVSRGRVIFQHASLGSVLRLDNLLGKDFPLDTEENTLQDVGVVYLE